VLKQSNANSKSVLDSLKRELRKTVLDTNRVNILIAIGKHLFNLEDGGKSVNYFNRSLQLSETIDYKKGIYVSNNMLGNYYANQDENNKAMAYYSKALAAAKELKDERKYVGVLSNIGNIYVSRAQYTNALENYTQALKIREKIKDTIGIATSKANIATIYYYQKKYDVAIKHYLSALENKKDENTYFYSHLYYNLALVYEDIKDYTNALKYFNLSLKISKHIDDELGVAVANNGIARVYISQEKYNEALDIELKALDLFSKLNDKKRISETYGSLGVIYDSLKQYSKAEECFKKQLSISEIINYKIALSASYLMLSNHYKINNKYKEAYDFFYLHKNMEDSIKIETNAKSLLEIQTEYETNNKIKEIELLKAEKNLQVLESKRNKQFTFSMFILATIVVLFIFILYNRKQTKNKILLQNKYLTLERNALAAQMNPHFIFNSLGSIGGFISENKKEKALEYLGVFSKLIRHNLEQSRQQLTTVTDEVKMLQSYLYLEQLRYNNKFDFKVIVAKNMEDSAAIPPMFIQPFVENAILHGILPKTEQGNIIIKFYIIDDTNIVCEVHDDGIGIAESLKRKTKFSPKHNSLALTITEERVQTLNLMYKEKINISTHDLLNENNSVTGTLVKLVFPLNYI
jgi:tetratricopeptide (TPR) repeat protein